MATTSSPPSVDPAAATEPLLRSLHADSGGLSSREASRRLIAHGPNELSRREGRRWPGQLGRQFTHPLALLLLAAAVLAFAQEQQAERAIEALAAYLPPHTTVIRDGTEREVEARELVPGDVMVI